MTSPLLQRALKKLAELPQDEQNAIAIIILSMLTDEDENPSDNGGRSTPDIGWYF